MNLVLISLLVLASAHYALSVDCSNAQVGEPNILQQNTLTDGRKNAYYLGLSMHSISCCGCMSEWQFYAVEPGNLTLMVWRPTAGGRYHVVGKDTFTTTVDGLYTFAASQFFVQSGDVVGWNTPGVEIIAYGSFTTPNYLQHQFGPLDISNDVSWTSTQAEYRTYALRFRALSSTAPVFKSGQNTTYYILDSTAVGTSVATVTFSDLDIKDDLELVMGNSQYFTFTDNGDRTGLINTHSINSVFPLLGRNVTLTFTATDLCGKTASGSFTINVINVSPVIKGLTNSVQISEDNNVETRIATFTCTDTDQLTTSLTVNPSNSPRQEFFFTELINGSTYGIYARAQTNPALGTFNYNDVRVFTLAVTCTDNKNSAISNLKVNLLPNSPPVITNLPPPTEIRISQKTRKGVVVFTVLFTDAENDSIAFSQTCAPVGCPFTVLESGVVQTTMDLITASGTGYDITFTVSDNKNAGIPRTLSTVITDLNVPPTFTNLPNFVNVEENTATLTSLFTVSYSDADVMDNHTLSVLSTPSRGNFLFQLDSLTGVLTVKAALNYEAEAIRVFTFNVTLSDGKASTTRALTVELLDVNEPLMWNSPEYRTNALDGAAVGTTLTSPGFAVTDVDINDTYKCYLDCGSLNGYFSLSTSCIITITSVYSLDLGLHNEVQCNVTATDKGLLSASTTLVIDVVDVDNYKPQFNLYNYGFTISSKANVGVSVGTVAATDLDVGTYGNFTYSLKQTGLPGSYFKINGTSGVILTQVSMLQVCNCTSETYVITALATDTGGLVGNSTVSITVDSETAIITTQTLTTTYSDKTFFDDHNNIIWFSVLVGFVFITVMVAVSLITKYGCTGTSQRYNTLGKNRLQSNPKRGVHPSKDYQPKAQMSNGASILPTDSIRKPPPKDFQIWKIQHMFRQPMSKGIDTI